MGVNVFHDVETLTCKVGRVIIRAVFHLAIIGIADLAEVHFAITGVERGFVGVAQFFDFRPVAGNGVSIAELVARAVIHVGYILGVVLKI